MNTDQGIYFCTMCGWQGRIDDCEIDDWGMSSCPECGESDLEKKEE